MKKPKIRNLLLVTGYWLLITLCQVAASEVTFKDVPSGHWASKGIYDLVKLGVTQGYPDGTFVGEKSIKRYETAIFLSKLVSQINIKASINEKIVEELKSELAATEVEFTALKEGSRLSLSGSYNPRFVVSKDLPYGLRVDYRLKTSLSKNFGNGLSLKINLDTMDAGFGTGSDLGLATKLIDLEGRMRLGGVDVKLGAGPGTIIHRDSGIASEYYMVYNRPKFSLTASTLFSPFLVSTSYIARGYSTSSGEVNVNEFSTSVLTSFENFWLGATASFLWDKDFMNGIDGNKDLRGKLEASFKPHTKIIIDGTFGIGKPSNGTYLALSSTLRDPFETGTFISLKGHRVDSEYRMDFDKYEFIPLNYFDKLILDGTVDLGFELTQAITETLSAKIKGDQVLTYDYKYGEGYPGTSITLEEGISYRISSGVRLDLIYRSFEVPSGKTSSDSSLNLDVPKNTDLSAISVLFSF